VSELLAQSVDLVSPWLDKKYGDSVTDLKIFRQLTAYWENEFMHDMALLNVKPCDILTRVSEYVPEIVAFVEKIIANGFAY
jgi:cysteinyl-tRNA synthetase